MKNQTINRDCQVKSNIRNINKAVTSFCWPLVKMVHLGLF